MDVNTRKNLLQPRKKQLSLKARDNESKIAKPAPKCVSSKKFIGPDEEFKELTPEALEDGPTVVQPFEDLSNHVYTLS